MAVVKLFLLLLSISFKTKNYLREILISISKLYYAVGEKVFCSTDSILVVDKPGRVFKVNRKYRD